MVECYFSRLLLLKHSLSLPPVDPTLSVFVFGLYGFLSETGNGLQLYSILQCPLIHPLTHQWVSAAVQGDAKPFRISLGLGHQTRAWFTLDVAEPPSGDRFYLRPF